LQERLRNQYKKGESLNMTVNDTSDFNKLIKKMHATITQNDRETFSQEVAKRWLNPKSIGTMENPDGIGCITGPCGDTMEIFLRIKDGKITNAVFTTDGCGTTVVAGSMAADLATGKDVREAMKISQEAVLNALGGLPEDSRHCALLASNTLKEAIKDYFNYRKDPWKKNYRK